MRYAAPTTPQPLAGSVSLTAADQLDPGEYVLLVMDDPFLRARVRAQIHELGLVVQESITVRRAIARVACSAPSLVVLDLWVEHGEGILFLEALRTADSQLMVPVLLLGDDPRSAVQVRALTLGAVGPVPMVESSAIAPWIERTLERNEPEPSI